MLPVRRSSVGSVGDRDHVHDVRASDDETVTVQARLRERLAHTATVVLRHCGGAP